MKWGTTLKHLMAIGSLAIGFTLGAHVAEAAAYTVLPFEDGTDYPAIEMPQRVESALQEQLLDSGKYDVKILQTSMDDVRKLLYEEGYTYRYAAEQASQTGNLSTYFESPAFYGKSGKKATVLTSGTTYDVDYISQLGKECGADYFIGGRVRNIERKEYYSTIPLITSQGEKVYVTVDFWLVRASDGAIIWEKEEQGKATVNHTDIIGIGGGTSNASEKTLMTSVKKMVGKFMGDFNKKDKQIS